MPPKPKNMADAESLAAARDSGFSKEFAAHLRRIRRAKLAADKLSADVSSPSDARSASVEILWEMLFDRLCGSEELPLADIGALAGIAQKLSSLKAVGGDSRGAASGGISPDTLSKIEERLRLL